MIKTKYPKRKKSKPLKAVFIYLAIIAVLSGLAYGYQSLNSYMQQRLSQFELEDVLIKGNYILSDKQILGMLGLQTGEKLLKISAEDVITKLKDSPYIRSVNAVYSLPSTLRITVTERKPQAFINGRGLNLIDSENVLLGIPKLNIRWNLPVITGISENLGVQGAETSSSQARLAVDIVRFIQYLDMPFREMFAELNFKNKDFIQVGLNGCSGVIRINYDKYQDQLFVAAKYFKDYQDYKMLNDLEYVDLRFDGQIVVKEKKV